jgi:hypothetical protein
MSPELATVQQLALEIGYLAACFADYADKNPKANETTTTN